MSKCKQVKIFYLVGLFFLCMSLFKVSAFSGPMKWPVYMTKHVKAFASWTFVKEIDVQPRKNCFFNVFSFDENPYVINFQKVKDYGVVMTTNLSRSPVLKINKDSKLVHRTQGELKFSDQEKKDGSIIAVIKVSNSVCCFILEDEQFKKHLFYHDALEGDQLHQIEIPDYLEYCEIMQKGGFIRFLNNETYEQVMAVLSRQGSKVQLNQFTIPNLKKENQLYQWVEIAPYLLQVIWLGTKADDFYSLPQQEGSSMTLEPFKLGQISSLKLAGESGLMWGRNQAGKDCVYQIIQDGSSYHVKMIELDGKVIHNLKEIRSDLFMIEFETLGHVLCTLVESESGTRFKPLKGLKEEKAVMSHVEDLGSGVLRIQFKDSYILYLLVESKLGLQLEPLTLPDVGAKMVSAERLGPLYKVRVEYSSEIDVPSPFCYYKVSQEGGNKIELKKVEFPKLNGKIKHVILGGFGLLYCFAEALETKESKCVFYEIKNSRPLELKKLGEMKMNSSEYSVTEPGTTGIFFVDHCPYEYLFSEHEIVKLIGNYPHNPSHHPNCQALGNLFKRDQKKVIMHVSEENSKEGEHERLELLIRSFVRRHGLDAL